MTKHVAEKFEFVLERLESIVEKRGKASTRLLIHVHESPDCVVQGYNSRLCETGIRSKYLHECGNIVIHP